MPPTSPNNRSSFGGGLASKRVSVASEADGEVFDKVEKLQTTKNVKLLEADDEGGGGDEGSFARSTVKSKSFLGRMPLAAATRFSSMRAPSMRGGIDDDAQGRSNLHRLQELQAREAELRQKVAEVARRERTNYTMTEEIEPLHRELKTREQRINKMERDVQMKTNQLDRRQKKLTEEEGRYGSLALREVKVAEREAELDQLTNRLGRRRRELRDLEEMIGGREQACQENEERQNELAHSLATREAEILNMRSQLLTDRTELDSSRLKFITERDELRKREEAAKEEKLRLDGVRQEQDERSKRVAEAESAAAATAQQLEKKEGALKEKDRSIQDREVRVAQSSAQVARDRDDWQKRDVQTRTKEREVFEAKREHDLKSAELKRRIAETAERVAHVARKEEESDERVKMLNERVKIVEGQTAQIEVREREVEERSKELNATAHDLTRRERRVEASTNELQQREMRIVAQEDTQQQMEESLQTRSRELDQRSNRLDSRDDELTSKFEELKQAQQRLRDVRAKVQDRHDALQLRERELADWMKEMEQRERYIRANEEQRNQPTAAGVVQEETSDGPKVPAHRFGKAVVEVQIRRLKDQYVAGRMRAQRRGQSPLGRLTLPNEATPKTPKSTRRSKRGGSTSAEEGPAKDLGEEALEAAEIADLSAKVRSASKDFRRTLAKTRAFDDKEDDASAEKQRQLSFFDFSDRLCINNAHLLEAHLDQQQSLVRHLRRCPLESRERHTDDKQMVGKMVRWWSEIRTWLRQLLLRTLRERFSQLIDALEVLQSKSEELPQLAYPVASSPRDLRETLTGGLQEENLAGVRRLYHHARSLRVVGIDNDARPPTVSLGLSPSNSPRSAVRPRPHSTPPASDLQKLPGPMRPKGCKVGYMTPPLPIEHANRIPRADQTFLDFNRTLTKEKALYGQLRSRPATGPRVGTLTAVRGPASPYAIAPFSASNRWESGRGQAVMQSQLLLCNQPEPVKKKAPLRIEDYPEHTAATAQPAAPDPAARTTPKSKPITTPEPARAPEPGSEEKPGSDPGTDPETEADEPPPESPISGTSGGASSPRSSSPRSSSSSSSYSRGSSPASRSGTSVSSSS
eukprot:Hpha_TRINITY_DN26268_c0_g1::TRINITY_DN26268_c0_g1_i1::g.184729::m.184729